MFLNTVDGLKILEAVWSSQRIHNYVNTYIEVKINANRKRD